MICNQYKAKSDLAICFILGHPIPSPFPLHLYSQRSLRKKSRVIFIRKKSREITDFRTIGILYALSKAFEILLKRLIDWLSEWRWFILTISIWFQSK